MRRVIWERSGSRPIHKNPPELRPQSNRSCCAATAVGFSQPGEGPQSHYGGLQALERPFWPRSWRSLSVRPWFPGWAGSPSRLCPWRAQPPLLGCHKGTFSGLPTPLKAQLETQATALVLLSSPPAVSPKGGCLKQGPTAGWPVLISVLHGLSEGLLAL